MDGLTPFSSPSRGSYISTVDKNSFKMFINVLVPFSGFLYLYKLSLVDVNEFYQFSSPSRGSYISTFAKIGSSGDSAKFSSPSRGSYISTMECVHWDVTGISSRPLLGVLISLLIVNKKYIKNIFRFSSPSRGSYISTIYTFADSQQSKSSRPLLGVLISLQWRL